MIFLLLNMQHFYFLFVCNVTMRPVKIFLFSRDSRLHDFALLSIVLFRFLLPATEIVFNQKRTTCYLALDRVGILDYYVVGIFRNRRNYRTSFCRVSYAKSTKTMAIYIFNFYLFFSNVTAGKSETTTQ